MASYDTRIRLLNVKPETWALLKESNRDELPLESEHDPDWHDYDGRLLVPEHTLANLSVLGSPEALLHIEVTDYEGYKQVGIYQLDSRMVRSIEKFERKVCEALGLEVQCAGATAPPQAQGPTIDRVITNRSMT